MGAELSEEVGDTVARTVHQSLRGPELVAFSGGVNVTILTHELTPVHTFGALAAYLGGYVDTLIMLVADVVLTLPQIVLLAVLATFIKLNSPWLLAAIIALLSWPTLLRAVRAQVL